MSDRKRPTLLTLITSYKDCEVDISRKEYMDINKGFMKFISNKILNGESVALPAGMGIITVLGRKQKIKIDGDIIKGAAPDWKSTLALWEQDPEAKAKKTRIFHFNEHTRGVRYKFAWLNNRVSLFNKQLFIFIPCRANKRALWKQILNKVEFTIIKDR